MDRTNKETIVTQIKEDWVNVQSIVLADTRGVDVATVTAVRDKFRAAGCHYRVVKNTLVKIAIKGTVVEPLSSMLAGPIALMWSTESPTEPAKIAVQIAKDKELFKIKGGFFDGNVLDQAGVETLAKMPGKDELRASLLMTFLAAPTDFVRLTVAGPQNFLYLLRARERSLAA